MIFIHLHFKFLSWTNKVLNWVAYKEKWIILRYQKSLKKKIYSDTITVYFIAHLTAHYPMKWKSILVLNSIWVI